MGIDTLRVIDTGLDPITAEREQWDDGNNTLAIGPRLAVAYERNVETNARLEEAGIEVVAIPGSELAAGGADRGACPARSPGTAPTADARIVTIRTERTSFTTSVPAQRGRQASVALVSVKSWPRFFTSSPDGHLATSRSSPAHARSATNASRPRPPRRGVRPG